MLTYLESVGVTLGFIALVCLAISFFVLFVGSVLEAVETFVEKHVLRSERSEYAAPLWMPIVGAVVGFIGLAAVITGVFAWNDAISDGCDQSHPCVKVVR